MDTPGQTEKVLIIGALGQIGVELAESLRKKLGAQQVISTDIRKPEKIEGRFELLDVLDREGLFELIDKEKVDTIYNLAAILSAKGEKEPLRTWDINMTALLNTLEALRHTHATKLFWPSSIAVFGPHSPKDQTPQYCTMDPNSVYGISKLAGERWCEYYHQRYDVDVRGLRYPGLIGYKSLPGGGTTDYAVEIFHEALKAGHYTCFLGPETELPMMFMPDAIRATIELMEAPADQIKVRSSYNLAGFSFTPEILVSEIQKVVPDFTSDYEPDFRQAIADGWPGSIDDSQAQKDWDWQPEYSLTEMCRVMIEEVGARHIGQEDGKDFTDQANLTSSSSGERARKAGA